MQIKRFSNFYISGITQLLSQTGWTSEQISGQLESVSCLSKSDNNLVAIAIERETVIGFLSLEIHCWNNLAQIQGLVIDMNHRRKGVASMLIQYAEKFATQKKVRGIYVDTPTDNHSARKFYEKNGFRKSYVMPEYYNKGKDGITYQKMY